MSALTTADTVRELKKCAINTDSTGDLISTDTRAVLNCGASVAPPVAGKIVISRGRSPCGRAYAPFIPHRRRPGLTTICARRTGH